LLQGIEDAMSDRAEMFAWVARVLGIDLSGTLPETGDLDQELLVWRDDMLAQAKRLADKEAIQRIEGLGAEATTAITGGRLGAAHSLLDAMATALTEAQKAATGRAVIDEAGEKVEYAKLLLRWRQAQAETRARIQKLASDILADPEVQADPRYDDVIEAASDLADAMPGFGSELEDVLDGLDKITVPEQRVAQVETARRLIDECRELLGNADELAELSSFAADEYAEADLAGELRDALAELAGTVAARI
jgi:hypothetical protein